MPWFFVEAAGMLLAVSALSWVVSLPRWAVRSRREMQATLAECGRTRMDVYEGGDLVPCGALMRYDGDGTAEDVLAQMWKLRRFAEAVFHESGSAILPDPIFLFHQKKQ